MKKVSLRAVFMVMVLVASMAAFLFLNSANSNHILSSDNTSAIDSTEVDNYKSLDVEILKHLIEQGKDQLPLLSTPASNTNVIE